MNRIALRNMARDYGWLLAIAVSVLSVIAVVAVLNASEDVAERVGADRPDVQLPSAPRSPDGVTACPDGWRATPGVVPPEGVQQLPPTHAGARSFYTCRKDQFEITIWDNDYISGYEGNNPLTQEQAREVLKR